MTPEETLDWLAQEHWNQCREDRPIQDWIRKMKSKLPHKFWHHNCPDSGETSTEKGKPCNWCGAYEDKLKENNK